MFVHYGGMKTMVFELTILQIKKGLGNEMRNETRNSEREENEDMEWTWSWCYAR